jgi:hypothetical protein
MHFVTLSSPYYYFNGKTPEHQLSAQVLQILGKVSSNHTYAHMHTSHVTCHTFIWCINSNNPTALCIIIIIIIISTTIVVSIGGWLIIGLLFVLFVCVELI